MTTHTSRLSNMTPSLSTSRKKGWSGAALHSGMVYGARGRCCLCRSAGAASSISVSPDEAPPGFPASAEELLVLGLGLPLSSAPAGEASGSEVAIGCCGGAGSEGFGGGGGGIEDDVLALAWPSTAADASDFDAVGSSGCGTDCEGLGGGGGGMEEEVVEEEEA